MSSHKRYLWDENQFLQGWHYNANGGQNESSVVSGLLPLQLNDLGTPIACMPDPDEDRAADRFFRRSRLRRLQQDLIFPCMNAHFTRSSMMLFMLSEIITHALITINSPSTRIRAGQHNLPRRLRNIIFTVPPVMPKAEINIFLR